MAEKIASAMPKLPHAKLGKYRGLAAEYTLQPVTDAQLAQALETLRLRAAQPRPIFTPAARGDDVVLDFAGFDASGAPIPESHAENVPVHLGRGQMLPGVEDKICGHAAGETFSIDFTYPETFRVASLSGTKASFAITLHTVLRKQKPPLDDAFAKSQGCENLDALKEKVRGEKAAMHQRMAQKAVRKALMDQAAENLIVTIPPAILDDIEEQRLQGLAETLKARGTNLSEYFRLSHQSEEKVRAEIRAEAEKGLRRRMATEAIAETEHLQVTQAECEAEYARLAEVEKRPADELRKTLTPAMVRGALLTEKACALLEQTAHITRKTQTKEE